MKNITLIYQSRCAECRRLIKDIEQIKSDPRFAGVKVLEINQDDFPEVAALLKHKNIPAVFAGDELLAEGEINFKTLKEFFIEAAGPETAAL